MCAVWPMPNPWSNLLVRPITVLLFSRMNRALNQSLNSLSLGQTVYVIDGNQRIVYSPDPAQLGRDLSKEASIQSFFKVRVDDPVQRG